MSVCVSVCLRVCLSVRGILPEPYNARSLPTFVHVAYVRGSILLRHVDDGPHRLSLKRDDGSAERGRTVIYDCLVLQWEQMGLLKIV